MKHSPPIIPFTRPLTHLDLSDALRVSTLNSSRTWIPLSLSVCTFSMPSYYAPCLADTLSNVVYAEELVYPDFDIREPYFAREDHRQIWRRFAESDPEFRDRGSPNKGWVNYKGQSGQNFVFHHVQYTKSFGTDSWAQESCMSKRVNTSPIQPLNDTEHVLPTVLIALSPDSFSFQHHLDRVTHIVAQAAHLPGGVSKPYVLTGRQGSKTVQELWTQMGYSSDHVLHQLSKVEAETMIFSCRAVLIHPWLSLKTLELLGIEHMTPATTRNKVVYMSRSDGRTANAGRRVLNEGAVLDGIRAYLAERNLGEELVVFNQDRFENVTQLFSWFSENVIAVIGPHGGAMINHRWARQDILVIEFMPTTRIAVMIYEEASLLSQTYAAIVVEPTPASGFDIEVGVDDVITLMRQHLGVAGADPLRKSYSWLAKELGFR
ncbi:hypothetical protein C8R43DRAFT_906944 [Mycena crocata]|nr:hypothetical protein C8R43DRAFT_906944 [Mycena crocata]